MENIPLIDYIQDFDDVWNEFFKENEKILENISNILQNKPEYYPSNDKVFNIFTKVKLNDIKVVIISKEPYSGTHNNIPITDGIPLSINEDLEIESNDIPCELKLIFKGLKSENSNYKFTKFQLDNWIKQGVFLMNSCFTVEKNKSNSHIKRNFWKPFIFKLIKKICDTNPDCIFIILGNEANLLTTYISNSCTKFVSEYPSNINISKFDGFKYMLKANDILIKKGLNPINWST